MKKRIRTCNSNLKGPGKPKIFYYLALYRNGLLIPGLEEKVRKREILTTAMAKEKTFLCPLQPRLDGCPQLGYICCGD